LINLVVDDTRQGFSFWKNTVNSEIYGCIIYYNGWDAPDRTHGHAVYTQNDTGTKYINDNIMFSPFSYTMHAYGSANAYINNFYMEGNVFFGGLFGEAPVLIGGGRPSEGIVFINNYTYWSRPMMGYSADYNVDLVFRDNYIDTKGGYVNIKRWRQAALKGNTYFRNNMHYYETPSDGSQYTWDVDSNTYMAGQIFSIDGSSMSFTEWQTQEGQDVHSTISGDSSTGTNIFIRESKYEPGRAHIIIYNWDLDETVSVDVSSIMNSGTSYEVRDAQNYFGPKILEGTYNGTPLTIPMTGLVPDTVVGIINATPVHTAPEFGVFVLISEKRDSIGTETLPPGNQNRVFDLNVSPNPVNSIIKIAVSYQPSAIGNFSLKIFDINGKILKDFSSLQAEDLSWNTTHLPAGVYLIKATIGNSVITRRIVLIK
jgi:hypothetical protein